MALFGTIPSTSNVVASAITGTLAGARLPAGSVLQVVTGSTSTEVRIQTTAFTDIGLSASITPSSTSSKVLIIASIQTRVFIDNNNNSGSVRLLRDSTSILAPSADFEYGYNSRAAFNAASEESYRIPMLHLDSPASTSSLTYKFQGRQRTTAGSNAVDFQDDNNFVSTIILMEIAG